MAAGRERERERRPATTALPRRSRAHASSTTDCGKARSTDLCCGKEVKAQLPGFGPVALAQALPRARKTGGVNALMIMVSWR